MPTLGNDQVDTAAAPAPVALPPALAALQHNLPPSLASKVMTYFTNPALSAADANTYALQFIRTTPWYQQVYPGIQAGISNGLFNDESGYLAHQNQLNQIYQQYLGRPASGAEVAHSVTQGFTASRVAAGLSGQAYIAANTPDIQGALGSFGTGPATNPQLKALGQEQAGIDSPLGQLIQRRVALATQRMQGAFKGTLASPAMSFATGRLAGAAASNPSDTAA